MSVKGPCKYSNTNLSVCMFLSVFLWQCVCVCVFCRWRAASRYWKSNLQIAWRDCWMHWGEQACIVFFYYSFYLRNKKWVMRVTDTSFKMIVVILHLAIINPFSKMKLQGKKGIFTWLFTFSAHPKVYHKTSKWWQHLQTNPSSASMRGDA